MRHHTAAELSTWIRVPEAPWTWCPQAGLVTEWWPHSLEFMKGGT